MVTDRRPIRAMSPQLAMKIAAGEVVERPASAVKELIDNAVDAGARHVRIEIREAGLKLIRVTDDGHGIARDDLPLAFASHATSKITDLDDLEHLTTLGFRGEALPSIAAVSRVDVQTRAVDEEAGSRMLLEFGEQRPPSVHSAAAGTRISIADLFSNVPARRKFVRSLRAEVGQIQQVVLLYALAQPEVQLTLTVDDRLVFGSPGTGKLKDTFASVYGPEVLERMLPVEHEDHGIKITGLISSLELTRANRSAISTFVNRRPIYNRSLGFALEEAYSGYLMTGRHPVAAVHLQLPPGDVDPNVHPSKHEVRFAREREVHGILHRAVATTLLEARLEVRTIAGTDEVESDGQATYSASPLPQMEEGEPESPPLVTALPTLRVFGQTNGAFIIAEGPDGLYMIDQHAAHERVLFDQLDDEASRGMVAGQALLEPALVELEPAQMLAIDDNGQLLTAMGFVLEPFGSTACLIRSVPAITRRESPTEVVRELLTDLQTHPEPGAARERALAMTACKAAVKAGQTLDVQEMQALVEQLERTPRPSTCPHGRPTMIRLTHSQLEREFGRR